MEDLITIENVDVAYGRRAAAVKDLSLTIPSGSSFALLGPNGAGKTSTLRLILGMVRPRKGTVRIFGLRPGSVAAFKQLGFAPEEGSAPEYLRAQEYLDFVGGFRIRDKSARKQMIESFLTEFELPSDKKVSDYSKGMRRKLILAAAFLGKPKLLILDEPLNGLDPLFIIKLRDRIRAYVSEGGTVLFSSHILAEVEKTCTEVGILKQGQLVCKDSMQNLSSKFGDVEKAFAHYMA